MIIFMAIASGTFAALKGIDVLIRKLFFPPLSQADKIRKKVIKTVKGISDVNITEITAGMVTIEAIASDLYDPEVDLQMLYETVKEFLPLGIVLKVMGPTLKEVSISGTYDAEEVNPDILNAAAVAYLGSLKKGEAFTISGLIAAVYGPLVKNIWNIVVVPEHDEKGVINATEDEVIRAGKINFTRSGELGEIDELDKLVEELDGKNPV